MKWLHVPKENNSYYFKDCEKRDKTNVAVRIDQRGAFVFQDNQGRFLSLADFKGRNGKEMNALKIAWMKNEHQIEFSDLAYEILTSLSFIQIKMKTFDTYDEKKEPK